jgi:hypothetical protein
VTADINQTAKDIEAFVRSYIAAGVAPKDVQVRPSGDDVDVIKVWIDLGTAKVDAQAWARECEAAIHQAVPGAAAFKVAVRVEAEA